jgi:TolB-like protein/AraC-like DNA-binding protein/Tfp pilus assembly protein PilF
MLDSRPIENDFLSQLTAIVEANISNEQFGVSELAEEMHMSRSNLLRRVKKETKLSVSQLISQVRLKRGMDLLRTSSLNVSEVSHQVGFSSTSYFIKCFREHYGYSPGEVGKRDAAAEMLPIANTSNRKRNFLIAGAVGLMVALAVGLLTYYTRPSSGTAPLEKSIAVLPFKNDSNDSTNVYLINGLMESTLNNLQKIKDLKVISRTSAEKYRNTLRSIPEMSKELNVNYFVEGSGQKIGDQILLNIQLIEAPSDRHLWSRQYRREAKDIFELQLEIARDIAEEIRAIITPEEEKRIEKKPTDDLVAYDLFLKGTDLLYKGGDENLNEAVSYFKKATEQDKEFALAYAGATTAYYYLDAFQVEKKYTPEINSNADKALLFDARLGESLVAKALFYMHQKEYELAVPYLEKALEYNPNSIMVINFLSDFYCNYIPNTTKYLEYALKGVRLDKAPGDSIITSYNYLRLGNALIQTGFIEESISYMDRALAYYPENAYAGYVKAWILFARDRDFNRTRDLLIHEFNKDTTRLDILQDIGKLHYLMRDYEGAYKYYKRFIEIREARQLDIYKHENLRIAILLSKMGFTQKSEEYVKSFKAYSDSDKSIYKNLALAEYYCYLGDPRKALEHMKLFSKEDNYQYWILLFDMETGIDPIKNHPEFKKIMGDIETRFWNTHKKIKVSLEEKGLLHEYQQHK